MRTFIALAALIAAPTALAQDGPRCQSADSFSARRCASAVADAIEAAAESRDNLEILNDCEDMRKKKDLQRCVADMAEATRRLGKAARVLAAAHESAAARESSSGTQMTR